MNKLLVSAAIVSSAAATMATPAYAGPVDGPNGRKCAYNSATDVTREAGWQTGQMNAGPLVSLTDGTLTCKVVVNNGNTHSSPAVVVNTVDSAGGVAVMEPRTINYPATAADDISLCTSWTSGGRTIYWIPNTPSPANPSTGHWDTDPGQSCGVSTTIEPNDPTCSIWKAIDRRAGTNIAEIWQDCEPYEEFPLPI